MGIGTSIFCIAVGAILRWAVTAEVDFIDIQTVGLILVVVGVIGLVVSFLWVALANDRKPDAQPVHRRDVR
jgi:heme/copper-type cytochrome/quinol oxidase subunit 2